MLFVDRLPEHENDIFIIVDVNITYQQNLGSINLGLPVSANLVESCRQKCTKEFVAMVSVRRLKNQLVPSFIYS
jgi:flagellar motor switch protein FliM